MNFDFIQKMIFKKTNHQDTWMGIFCIQWKHKTAALVTWKSGRGYACYCFFKSKFMIKLR